MTKKKYYYEAAGSCPHCKKPIQVQVKRAVITKSIPAEIELSLSVGKDTQQKL